MAVARETVGLGLSARAGAKIKLRQPLHEAVVVAAGRERAAIERLSDIVREELNVRELRFVEAADELGSYEIKPNYRTLGPRFGKAMPQVAAAVEALDAAHVAATLRARRPGRRQHRRSRARAGLRRPRCWRCARWRATSSSARARTRSRWSWRSTTSCGARASRARSSTPCRARARPPGLAVEDRISLVLGGDEELLGAARAHEGYLAGEVLAVSVGFDGALDGTSATIEGRELRIAVARA